MGAQLYYLEWLDLLISVTLNPLKTDLDAINSVQIETIASQITEEKERIQSLLKNQVFATHKESQIQLLIKKYHSTLIILLDQAVENKKIIQKRNSKLNHIFNQLVTCLDELLSFIEVRFSAYLSLDERVPTTYLSVTKKELNRRLQLLNTKLYKIVPDRRIVDIVLQALFSFTSKSDYDYTITFRSILYRKELIKELEVLEDPEKETCLYTALNELLIYLNFNSKAFANHFTQQLASKVNQFTDITDRLDQLLVHFKEFNQMHRKPEAVLNPQNRDLKDVLSNWFVQEIFYLEKKMHLSVRPLQGEKEASKSKSVDGKVTQKVLCILSSDQTGLILRAADELRILIAKSMNEVFKTIVPHLSTPYKDDLSYDGMRSKSYVAEERDKQIAIETLEKIIKKIRDY